MLSKRTRFMVVAVIIAGFALNMFTPAAAATYVPGVKQGDYWKYDEKAATMTVEIKLEVKSVTGTVVSLSVTAVMFSMLYDIDVTNSTLELGMAFLVAKGLSPGDPITLGNSISFTSSAVRTYAGGSRTVNYVTSSSDGGTYQAYFDKETGILCEMNVSGPGISATIILKETNLWLNVVLVIIVVAVVSTIAVASVGGVILLRRRRRGKK